MIDRKYNTRRTLADPRQQSGRLIVPLTCYDDGRLFAFDEAPPVSMLQRPAVDAVDRCTQPFVRVKACLVDLRIDCLLQSMRGSTARWRLVNCTTARRIGGGLSIVDASRL
jgi:hypothetical protein